MGDVAPIDGATPARSRPRWDDQQVRIIAGRARGRRLSVPPGRGTRPSSDRMREGLFSALSPARAALTGCRFLDLYAGSGAVGHRGVVARRRTRARGRAGPARRAGDQAQRRHGRGRRRGRRPGLHGRPARDDQADRRSRTTSCSPTRRTRWRRRTSPTCSPRCTLRGWFRPDALVVVERASRKGFTWPALGDAVEVTQLRGGHTLVRPRAGRSRPGRSSQPSRSRPRPIPIER